MIQKNTYDTGVLRKPGVTVSIVLALMGWLFLLKDQPSAFLFSLSAVVLVSISLIKPSLLVDVKKGLNLIWDILGALIVKIKQSLP